jgi:hypothetical protein
MIAAKREKHLWGKAFQEYLVTPFCLYPSRTLSDGELLGMGRKAAQQTYSYRHYRPTFLLQPSISHHATSTCTHLHDNSETQDCEDAQNRQMEAFI